MSSLPRKVGKRSQYPESFQRDAVRLSTERSVRVAAEELGLSSFNAEQMEETLPHLVAFFI